MSTLVFNSIISDKTHYGVIWKGTYKGKDCVIKQVLLNTGIHYNRREKVYYNGSMKISRKVSYFDTQEHKRYRKKKSMTLDKFQQEVDMLKDVSKIELAPKIYHVWMEQDNMIHYGFIAMEYLSMTVKDILLRRDLTRDEYDFIMTHIHKLHNNKIKHGDMKPSNMGCNLDKSGDIIYLRMIDWAKGEYTSDISRLEKDIRNFHKHIERNTNERT